MKKFSILVLLIALSLFTFVQIDASARDIMICDAEGYCYVPGGGSTPPPNDPPQDVTPPVIYANTTTQYLSTWEPFNYPSCSAYDSTGSSIACEVTGSVDIFTPGIYTIYYRAVDSAGNTTVKQKLVLVTNKRIDDDLILSSYCKSNYYGSLTPTQATECQLIRNTHTLLARAKKVETNGNEMDVYFGDIQDSRYCSTLGSNYVSVGEKLEGRFITNVTDYRSTNRKSFVSGSYYYRFVTGWNIFSHTDDYHKKYAIHNLCQQMSNSVVSINLADTGLDEIYFRKYAEYVSTFNCNYVGSMPQECHHMVNQYFVPVKQIRDHLNEYLQILALQQDPGFDISDFIAPGGTLLLNVFYQHLVSKGILTTVAGKISVTPVTVASVLYTMITQFGKYLNATHANEVKAMLTVVYNFVLTDTNGYSANNNKFVVFSQANQLSIDNMEVALFPSQEHKTPRPDSDFDKTDLFYRYTITPYTKSTLSHILSRDELVSAKISDVFYDSNALLYSEITRIENMTISDLFGEFVIRWTP